MRDSILLLVNGKLREVRGRDAFLTLSDYLRNRLGLKGTKIVCSEGDCGSCTVLCGFPRHESRATADGHGQTNAQSLAVVGYQYRAIDSCIRFVFQLDGVHIVTVEGLADDDASLNGVQDAMVRCHGSQCGFCTPGFVMAMTGMFQNTEPLSTEEIRYGLTGNLCRCTGYSPIIEAASQPDVARKTNLNERFPFDQLSGQLNSQPEENCIKICAGEPSDPSSLTVYCPSTIDQTTAILKDVPGCRIVAGATDLGVLHNKDRLRSRTFIDLNRVSDLDFARVEEGKIVAGAMVSWSRLEQLTKDQVPEFHRIISIFGSPQIRHVGTLGGNLINASPIADSIPFLMITHATLTLTAQDDERTIDINDFYTAYKKFDLRPGELLTRIEIPLPECPDALRLYKVSRRRDMDISTFTAAIHITQQRGMIQTARIAMGAVAPTVVRLQGVEEFLMGRPFCIETFRSAGDRAISEITPITDVRGNAQYRRQLAKNVLLKYFHETSSDVSAKVR